MKGSTSLRLKKFEKKGKEITANIKPSDVGMPSATTKGFSDIELPTVNSEVAGRLQGATKATHRKMQLEAKGTEEDGELEEIQEMTGKTKKLNGELQQKIKYLKRLRGE